MELAMGKPKEEVVSTKTIELLEEVPVWDVALAALARDEYKNRGAPLGLEDFRRLAEHYGIRFDDIMATMFELVIQGEWRYQAPDGKGQAVTRDAVDRLYVNGRLHAKDLMDFSGEWRPAP